MYAICCSFLLSLYELSSRAEKQHLSQYRNIQCLGRQQAINYVVLGSAHTGEFADYTSLIPYFSRNWGNAQIDTRQKRRVQDASRARQETTKQPRKREEKNGERAGSTRGCPERLSNTRVRLARR